MNIRFLEKPLGILLIVFILFSICSRLYYGAIDVVQVNVIKKISPSYVTRHEAAEQQKKQQAQLAEEETKKEQPEIDLENYETSKYQEMERLINEGKILGCLKKKNTELVIPSVKGFYVLDGYIWISGVLLVHDENSKRSHYCPVVIGSEDGGNSYKLLKVFREFDTGFMHSNLFFLDKNIGYLEIFGAEYNKNLRRAIVYKTIDGGYYWKIILDTTNLRLFNGCISRIRAENQKISLVTGLQTGGSFDLIQSNDGGESWLYIRNGKELAKTCDKGKTWETSKK